MGGGGGGRYILVKVLGGYGLRTGSGSGWLGSTYWFRFWVVRVYVLVKVLGG